MTFHTQFTVIVFTVIEWIIYGVIVLCIVGWVCFCFNFAKKVCDDSTSEPILRKRVYLVEEIID